VCKATSLQAFRGGEYSPPLRQFTLTVKTVKQDGTLVDTFIIDQVKDTSSDCEQPPVAMAVPMGAGR
jgi:hypothetical protein